MAAMDAGAHKNNTPRTRLAMALLLLGGRAHSCCAIAICGTGCDTPQYGHKAAKSGRLPRQFVHCFKKAPPARTNKPEAEGVPRMYKEVGRFVYRAIQAPERRKRNLLEMCPAGLSKPQGRERMAALCRTKTWLSSFWLLAEARG